MSEVFDCVICTSFLQKHSFMEPEIYRFRLKKNYETILRDLEPKKLIGFLYQDDIFDEDDMDEVRSEKTRKKQAVQFLETLNTKHVAGYAVLVKALEEKQPHLARILKTPVRDENLILRPSGTKHSGQPISMEQLTEMLRHQSNLNPQLAELIGVAPSYANDPVEQSEQSSQHPHHTTESCQPFNSSTDAGLPFNIKRTNFQLISPLYRPHLLDSVYKMTSSPRGLAVIINIMNFEPDPSKHCKDDEKLDSREGSELDLHALGQLFSGLNFRVMPMEDKKEDEIRKELKGIARSDLSQYDCFVLCIMSHGKKDFFYSKDGGKIKISEIKKMFNNSECESLCQKPKLFFIQACRGDLKDFGRTVSDAPSEHNEKEKGIEADAPSHTVPKSAQQSTSDNAHFLLAYSSVEGYPSFRNTARGSRFITWLVDIFRDYAGVEDVESMMTRVIKEVNKAGQLWAKQVPKPETTLTKKVFFWPGIQNFHI